ncbi:unnamed protein product [Peniophora sp. CBMAI 1063]|nr:unnamed protein product [Peniophora sp. CBMAI 1063]
MADGRTGHSSIYSSYYTDDDEDARGRLRQRTRQRSSMDADSTNTQPPTRGTSMSMNSHSFAHRSTSPQPPTSTQMGSMSSREEAMYPQYRPREGGLYPDLPDTPVPGTLPAEPRYRAHDPWSHRRRTHSPPIDLAAQAQASRPYGYAPNYPSAPPAMQPDAPYGSVITPEAASGPYPYSHHASPSPNHPYASSTTSPWPTNPIPYTPAAAPLYPQFGQPATLASSYNSPSQNTSNAANVFGQEVLLDIGKALLVSIPQEVYMLFLLRLPRFYFSRVARVFEDAELSMPDIIRIYTTSAREWQARQTSGNGRINIARLPVPTWNPLTGTGASEVTPAMEAFKDSWESFIGSLLQEWNTLNIISALLSASILTLLSLGGTADDPITRTAAVISLLCSIWSIIYASMYIVRFGPMRKMYKAASWAKEAKERTNILWNVWALLAMPAVWLMWSLIAFLVAIMSYVWRTNSVNSPDSRTTSVHAALATRIVISCVLGLGLVYFLAMLNTFRRYGEKMDSEWRKTIAGLANQAWLQQRAGVQAGDYPFYYGSVTQQHPNMPYGPAYPPLRPHYPPPYEANYRQRSPSRSSERISRSRRSSPPTMPYQNGRTIYVDPPNPEYGRQGVRRSSLRSPSRPPRRSSTGDSLSVRVQATPHILNPSTASNLRLPRSAVSRPSFDTQSGSGDYGAVPLSTISERTEPITPPTAVSALRPEPDGRPLAVTNEFDAFRAVTLYNIDMSSARGIPLQLHIRGMSENIWKMFLKDLQRAWQAGVLPEAGHPSPLLPPEAVFHICRIWSEDPCPTYGVRPLLCEEWLETGLMSYTVYFLDLNTVTDDLRHAFRDIPTGVKKLVLLWKEPVWDADYRRVWTLHRDVPPPAPAEHHSEQHLSGDLPGRPHDHPLSAPASSDDASTTMLGTGLSDSPHSLQREVTVQADEEERARTANVPRVLSDTNE